MTQAAALAPATEARINTFLARVYLLMSLGLAVTGVVSYLVSENIGLLIRLNTNPWLAWGLFIVQIVVVAILAARVMSLSPAVATLIFLGYAALTGLSISSIFLVYRQEQITSVFLLTAGAFLITSVVGMVLKRDMSGSGQWLFMLLAGWTLAWLLSWLFPFSNFGWALNYVGIALFVGLTAWDAQQLRKMGEQIGDQPGAGGLVVIGALRLYLDYINLFLLLLRASSRSR
jgi:FtsH-binding integral membrane protein